MVLTSRCFFGCNTIGMVVLYTCKFFLFSFVGNLNLIAVVFRITSISAYACIGVHTDVGATVASFGTTVAQCQRNGAGHLTKLLNYWYIIFNIANCKLYQITVFKIVKAIESFYTVKRYGYSKVVAPYGTINRIGHFLQPWIGRMNTVAHTYRFKKMIFPMLLLMGQLF